MDSKQRYFLYKFLMGTASIFFGLTKQSQALARKCLDKNSQETNDNEETQS